MIYDMVKEFAVCLTGDDSGVAAWLQQALLDTVGQPAQRAMLHWEGSSVKVRTNICEWLGYADEPPAPGAGLCHVHPAIRDDYKAVDAQMSIYFGMA